MYSRRHKKNQKAFADMAGIDTERIHKVLTENSNKEWLSYSIPVQETDPLAYAEYCTDENNLYYWEQPGKQFSIVAGGAVTVLKATGPNRFDDIGDQYRQLKTKLLTVSAINHDLENPIFVGGYSFSDHNIQSTWKKFGAARFQLPEWAITRSGKLILLTLSVSIKNREASAIFEELEQMWSVFLDRWNSMKNTRLSEHSGKDESYKIVESENAYSDWLRQVVRCRKMISSGAFKKIVIARTLDFETSKPIRATRAMYQLRRRFPECFNFMIKMDGGPVFIGATPERLISIRKKRILTEGLAGSISRGESASEDVALGHTLMESLKERSEHDYVVEDIRNNLRKYSLRVEHPRQPVIKKLRNVQHLYTPISAEVEHETTIHELAGTLHPTPAVGGFPKNDAVPYINEIENIDRGWYAGPVGWFNIEGSGEFAVAIRSALVHEHRARLYAGCGIVWNSDPAKEWQETFLKFDPVFDALKHATKD